MVSGPTDALAVAIRYSAEGRRDRVSTRAGLAASVTFGRYPTYRAARTTNGSPTCLDRRCGGRPSSSAPAGEGRTLGSGYHRGRRGSVPVPRRCGRGPDTPPARQEWTMTADESSDHRRYTVRVSGLDDAPRGMLERCRRIRWSEALSPRQHSALAMASAFGEADRPGRAPAWHTGKGAAVDCGGDRGADGPGAARPYRGFVAETIGE